MPGLFFAAGVVGLAILLAGLGFLLGRSVRTEGDARGAYLALGTFVSLLVFVVGLGVALDGLVRVALPGHFAAEAGPQRMMGHERMPPEPEVEPLEPDPDEEPPQRDAPPPTPDAAEAAPSTPDAVPRPPSATGYRPAPARMLTAYPDRDAVREAGLVQSLRGVIVMLTAGVFFVGTRRLAPEARPGPSRSEDGETDQERSE